MAECTLCCEKFNAHSRTPRLLPCAHTFCLVCLQNTIAAQNQAGQIACALCKRKTPVPVEGAEGFPRNFNLLDLLDPGAGSADGPGAGLCAVCHADCSVAMSATHSCQDCTKELCANHAGLHGIGKASKGHRVRGLAGVVCGDHECLLEYFCSTHAKPLCVKCRLETHATCLVEKLQVVFEQRQAEMLAIAGRECRRAKPLVTMAQRAGEEAGTVAEEGKQALEETRGVFGRLHAVLQQRQAAVEAHVQALVDRKTQALKAQETQLREEAGTMEGDGQRLQRLVQGRQMAGALDLAGDLGRKQSEADDGIRLAEQHGVWMVWEDWEPRAVQLLESVGTVVDMSTVCMAACTMAWDDGDAVNETVQGAGAGAGRTVQVGEEVVGVITTRDRVRGTVRRGGLAMSAKLERQDGLAPSSAGPGGNNVQACAVEDRGNGTYGIQVRAEVAGDYVLVASCRGAALAASLRLCVRSGDPVAQPPVPQMAAMQSLDPLVVIGSRGKDQGHFICPTDIALDPAGNLYVADYLNHRVQVFRSDGSFVRMWGIEGSGQGHFNSLTGVAWGPDGLVYTADFGNHRVQVFRSDGTFVRMWGIKGTGQGQFSEPRRITVGPDGLVFVTDSENHRIQIFRSDGSFVGIRGSKGSAQGQLSKPRRIAVSKSGELFVAESGNHRVQVFAADGSFVRMWGSKGSGPGQFVRPNGVALGPDGLLYVADLDNHRIQVFRCDGSFVRMWGGMGSSLGQFNSPRGVLVSSDGVVYVTDSLNNRVQCFAKDL